MAGKNQKDFFSKFTKSISWKKLKQEFESIFGGLDWCLFSVNSKGEFKLVESKDPCQDESIGNRLRNSLQSLKSKDLLKIQPIQHRLKNRSCLIFPIINGNKVYGILCVCNYRHTNKKQVLILLQTLVTSLSENAQKELELVRLFNSIRPRTVALSTVHTLHRLISSTLNIDELLPRITRVCLQILRARSCSIMLMNKSRTKLVTKSCIGKDYSKKLFPSNVKIGQGAQGKVAKYATAIFKKNLIVVPLLEEEVMGVITVANKIGKSYFTNFDLEILRTLAEQAIIAIKNAQLYSAQEKIVLGAIKSLVAILESKLPYKYTHSHFYVNSVLLTAKELGLSNEQMRNMHYAALLPDATKLALPENILNKKSSLTKEEFEIVKQHPIKLAEMIKPLEILRPVIPIILHHHERYDGTGYPSKLKGDKIPIGARIAAVADAFEAMIGKRPYRKARTVKGALEELTRYSGTQFDPKVIDVFIKLFKGKTRKSLLKKLDTV